MSNDTKPADQPLFLRDDEMFPEGGDFDALPSGARAGAVRKRKIVTTLTLSSRTCRWPIGDPATAEFHYCGMLPRSGRPYCDEHDRLSYQVTLRKKTTASFR